MGLKLNIVVNGALGNRNNTKDSCDLFTLTPQGCVISVKQAYG